MTGRLCFATSSLKPQLHERFFACDGDATVFLIVASPARGGGYTWRQSPRFYCKKFNSLNFSRFFFCDFFSYRITCARVATHAIFAALWRRDNFKKSHHHHKQKNHSCSRGFMFRVLGLTATTPDILLQVLATRK